MWAKNHLHLPEFLTALASVQPMNTGLNGVIRHVGNALLKMVLKDSYLHSQHSSSFFPLFPEDRELVACLFSVSS